MVIEKGVLKTEAVFSDNKEHRYVLRKEWDSKKKTATIIMLNSGFADSLKSDCTTLYIINNLSKLDFGSVNIVNIFSKIMIKLKTKENLKTFTDDENTNQILKASEKQTM